MMFKSTFSRRQWIQTTAALTGIGSFVGQAAQAQTPSAQQAALPTGVASALSGPDRTAQLLEVAKKEGTLTVYSSMPQDDMAALAADCGPPMPRASEVRPVRGRRESAQDWRENNQEQARSLAWS